METLRSHSRMILRLIARMAAALPVRRRAEAPRGRGWPSMPGRQDYSAAGTHLKCAPSNARCAFKVRPLLQLVLGVVTIAICASPRAIAQAPASLGLDPTALVKPATDTWPTYNGDYT